MNPRMPRFECCETFERRRAGTAACSKHREARLHDSRSGSRTLQDFDAYPRRGGDGTRTIQGVRSTGREFVGTGESPGGKAMIQPPGHHLAELNIGRIRYELDDPRMAGFADNLALVNGIAERSPGFVWRYTDESGNASNTRPYDDPLMIVNVSVWENVESLEKYVWQTVHKRFYAHRDEWFDKMKQNYFVMWWVPAGQRPTMQEAIARLEHLRANGPSEHAFGWESLASAQLWK